MEDKITIRVDGAWRRRVKAEAALRGLTLAELVRRAIDQYLDQNPIENPKVKEANEMEEE